MTRPGKIPTAICRRCRKWTGEGCDCSDHKRCSDCNMPRCVLLADQNPGVR